jgi:hypothetical protein
MTVSGAKGHDPGHALLVVTRRTPSPAESAAYGRIETGRGSRAKLPTVPRSDPILVQLPDHRRPQRRVEVGRIERPPQRPPGALEPRGTMGIGFMQDANNGQPHFVHAMRSRSRWVSRSVCLPPSTSLRRRGTWRHLGVGGALHLSHRLASARELFRRPSLVYPSGTATGLNGLLRWTPK